MPHFIVKSGEDYLYHRRKERGKFSYEARAAWGPDVGQARVFTTRSAASNACPAMPTKGEVVEVELVPHTVPTTALPVTEEPTNKKLLEENDAFRFFLRELMRVQRFSYYELFHVTNIDKERFEDMIRWEHAGLIGHFILDPKNSRLVARTERKEAGQKRCETELVLVPIFALETLAVALGSIHWKQMLAK